MRHVPFNIDLLKKYNKSGPRYTSYPTSPHFHEGISEVDYKQQVLVDNIHAEQKDLSLYFHIPFCDSLCYFCGCFMTVTRNEDRIEKYLTYLGKEMSLVSQMINSDRRVRQIHWGGGTPTHLSPDQIRQLGSKIHKYFKIKDDAEISVEIDPRELTYDHMKALREIGFNRTSMGVQDFDPQVQAAVNRIQPEEITIQAIEWARTLGFESMNIDLMYGLPHQTLPSYEETLDKIVDINPDRVAVFNYAHLPSMIKHQKLIKDEWLPTPHEKLLLLKASIEKLTEAEYEYIGMDHFAKPNDELTIAMNNGTLYRNFQGYSTHAGLNLFAFGVSSIGMLSKMYVQNHKKFNTYYEALDQGMLPIMKGYRLSQDDLMRREVITRLMCHFRLDKSIIEKKYDISFDQYFKSSLKQLENLKGDGLINDEERVLVVTDEGRLLIRNIAMCFDAYLEKKTGVKPIFSKTI